MIVVLGLILMAAAAGVRGSQAAHPVPAPGDHVPGDHVPGPPARRPRQSRRETPQSR
jgi:hypothetical protein